MVEGEINPQPDFPNQRNSGVNKSTDQVGPRIYQIHFGSAGQDRPSHPRSLNWNHVLDLGFLFEIWLIGIAARFSRDL
jgi:hypothetical protein